MAAVVAGVVLVHGLLLARWAGPGLPAAPGAPPVAALPQTTSVRTIAPLQQVVYTPAVSSAGPALEPAPEPRVWAVPPAPPTSLAPPPQAPQPAVSETPEPITPEPIAAAVPAPSAQGGVADPVIAAASAAAPRASPAPAPAAAQAQAQAQAVPRYAAALPPPFEADFRLRRGALAGRATWSYSTRADSYQLSLQTRVLGREVSHLRSEGRPSPTGLEPLRFVEGRRGRDQRAVNFVREPGGGRISFSGPADELPLPAGVQDRLSWLLQLAAIVDTDPALRVRGAEVSMWVVSPRGGASVWTFVVGGMEPVPAGDGTERSGLALRRDAQQAWDTEVRIWLDPAARHLPLRATWRSVGPDAEPGIDIWRETLTWR